MITQIGNDGAEIPGKNAFAVQHVINAEGGKLAVIGLAETIPAFEEGVFHSF